MTFAFPHPLRQRTLFVLLAATSTACVPEFDDDAALVSEPRVLAVRSVPAEAGADETVTLEVLVASPEGEDDGDVAPDWALCSERKPLTELGPVAQACVDEFGSNSDKLVSLPSGLTSQATLPEDVCRYFGPLTPPKVQGQAAGRPVDPDPTGGYYQPVLVDAATSGSTASVSLGSVRLTCEPPPLAREELIQYALRYRPNENPSIDAVTISGDARLTLTPDGPASENRVKPGSVLTLAASFASCPRTAECGDGICSSGEDVTTCATDCGSDASITGCTGSESYVWVNPRTNRVEDRHEGITVSWYATSGKFDSAQTGFTESDAETTSVSNRFTAPSTPGTVRMWVVIRDDRGGVGWQRYELQVKGDG